MKMVEKIQDDIGFFRDKNGRVSGEVVAAFRSKLGTTANIATDPQTRRGYYAIQSIIDDMLMEQMPQAAKEAFKRESQKWKSNVILRETVEFANGTKGMRGDFTETEWLSQAFINSKYDKRYMGGPLVKEALSLESNVNTVEKAIAKRAANIAKRKAHTIEKTMRQHRSKLKADIERLEASNKSARNRTRVNYEADLEAAVNNPRIINAKQELDSLEKELAKLSKLSSSKNPSWFHTLAAHNMLSQVGAVGGIGYLAGGPVGAGVAAFGSYGLGRGLASQGGQKLLAGQTGAQQGIQRMLQSDMTGRTADILARAGGKGMFTGQQ